MNTSSHRLNRNDAKTLSLSALGGALEFYDFVIYVYFANVVGHLFFPPNMPEWLTQVQTYGIFAAGYLARPLGGVVMAHFGDLLGRKRMFMFSIFLMAVPTLAIGLMPTYATIGIAAPLLLLLFRVMQGAAIGGEAPGAWVFVTEHVSPRHTGLACGTLSGGLVAGILIGSLVATGVHASMSAEAVNEWGWRLPFILGGLFGFVTMYLRRWLHETPVFTEMQERQQLAEELPIKTVVKDHLPSVTISMAVTWVLTAAIVVTILMTPALLQKMAGLDPQQSLEANSLAIVALFIGCVISGSLADRFGNGPIMAIFSVGLAISYAVFFSLMLNDTSLLFVLYPVVGFFAGLVGVVPSIAVKSFPAAIRFTGLSFSYNLAYAIFGGTTPLVVSMLLGYNPLAPVYYVSAVALIGVIASLAVIRFRRQLDLSPLPA
ncbi:MAG: MFS transporter [Oceanospirillaceae bacterium]|uniref:MFS transporter n=1 Tax=unclassified Thalassolituus TaxID=2624967 RepID=UPI000C5DE92F|nr:MULTISPECIES: MFS transporter [unclassified Thalassolituus]MAS24146.1 MFS transporter [Oceanospirillaceae bacterium]MBL35442.1 MFS transporter [Oceanospirillaceae bacterium]MBS51875.1 MFS transporter [Oceanospirillaceae bacterium]|tara:strand:+ start:5840 stop:7135 length:1296 start_codon:yes stop_codon:yes gene_type:complete